MLATGLYKKLSDTISGIQKASSDDEVWKRAKYFAAEFNCNHCVALDNERLPSGLSKSLLYSDVPADVCADIDRKGLNVGHPFETYARENCLPFLASDVRRDARFHSLRWSELISNALYHGDAVITPVRVRRGLAGAAVFAGQDIKDSPVARSSLMVVAHAAFDRCDALVMGVKPEALALLSTREIDCLQILARGLPDEEAARLLGITKRTVRYHVDHAKQKLGVSSRVHAVAAAVNRGLITL
jgi:DNA-binding CsgD family transcriptional regulator